MSTQGAREHLLPKLPAAGAHHRNPHSLGVNPSEGRRSSAASTKRPRGQARARHLQRWVSTGCDTQRCICTSAGWITCGPGQLRSSAASKRRQRQQARGTHRTGHEWIVGCDTQRSMHPFICTIRRQTDLGSWADRPCSLPLNRRSTSVKLCCQQAKSSTVAHDQALTSRSEKMDGT